MSKRNGKRDSTTELLRGRSEDERRLLKRERRAERELLEARALLAKEDARLERAQARVKRRRAEVVAAEARLRERQVARAIGPAASSAENGGPGPATDGKPTAGKAADSGEPVNPTGKRSQGDKGKLAAAAADTAGAAGATVNPVSIAAAMGVPNV